MTFARPVFVSLSLCAFCAGFSFSQETSVNRDQNVVNINISFKDNGDIEIAKETRPLAGDPEKRIIKVKDSDTGNPVPHANVEIDDTWDVITSKLGNAEIPDEVQDGEHSMVITKGNEYVRTQSNFSVSGGEIVSQVQISIPKVVEYERYKIVLDWGEYPSDLDSHIFSDRYHVYFSNMNAFNLNLDRDDTTSYGPETVTVRDIASSPVYSYYVHDYTNGGHPGCYDMSNSGAQVRLFYNNELIQTFQIKPNQPGIVWHVFDIVNGSEIVKFDTVSDRFD